ncbi:MAG TPA: PAS domain S-box protein, partial [Puia sp.]|nr:PAS domain S-box protein [Puia sp.]
MQAPVALTILRGPDFNIELANEKALELWDRKMEHVINKQIFDSFPELKAQGWREILQHVYTTGEKYISDETPFFLKRDGQLQAVYINFVYEALKDPNGKITGIMGVGVDVTDQVKARHKTGQVDIHDRNIMTTVFEKLVEKRTNELSTKNIQLKESEERYHKMIDEIQDYAILLINRDGIIQNWNKGAEKIKGYKTEEILGKHFRIFYQREDQEKKLPELMLANATKFGRAMHEGWRVRKDGSKFWGSVTVTALHDENQNIMGFTKITRDLTDIKIANDELKEFAKELELKNIELERMNSELEQFAYVASHDLQEPLRKIRTYSGILSENLQSQPTGVSIQILNKILNAGERMSTLIYDLLNFSRLAYPSDAIEPTDLNKTLQKVIDDFELKIEQKQAQIHLDTLPIINAIPLQMNQLFNNLLNNSLKFSKLDASP